MAWQVDPLARFWCARRRERRSDVYTPLRGARGDGALCGRHLARGGDTGAREGADRDEAAAASTLRANAALAPWTLATCLTSGLGLGSEAVQTTRDPTTIHGAPPPSPAAFMASCRLGQHAVRHFCRASHRS